VGELVRKAQHMRLPLKELPLEVFTEACPELNDDSIFDVLGVDNAIKAFVSYGSTAPQQVLEQVRRWKEKLSKE